jgi:hypothetical protein
LQLRLPLVNLVAGHTRFQRQLRRKLLAVLEQYDRLKLDFLGEPHAFALRIDLLVSLSRLKPPPVLSTFKSVRKTRVSSV